VEIDYVRPADGAAVCPFCGSSDLTGETVSSRFVYMRCGNCDLVNCFPREIPLDQPVSVPRGLLDRLAAWMRSLVRVVSR
jgi:hypothetical protein